MDFDIHSLAIAARDYLAPFAESGQWWIVCAVGLFLAMLFGTWQHQAHPTGSQREAKLAFVRRCMFWTMKAIFGYPLLMFCLSGIETHDIDATLTIQGTWWRAMAWQYAWMPITAVTLAKLYQLVFLRFAVAWWSQFGKRFRANQSDDQYLDIRNEFGKYGANDFDPIKYFKPDQVFFGLSGEIRHGAFKLQKRRDPIYMPLEHFRSNHISIIGPTGFGKSVLFGVLIAQAILRNDFVFVLDPGEDNNLRNIMNKFCKLTGRKFVYLDMDEEGSGQWDPFRGGSVSNKRTRLMESLGIVDGGSDSDFYKGQERLDVDDMLSQGCRSLGEMKHYLLTKAKANPDQRTGKISKGKALQRIEEFSNHPAFCPKPDKGLDILDAITKNAVVYVRGDISSDPLIHTASRIMLLEIIQALRITDRNKSRKVPAFVLFDEAKFLVSKPLVSGLALLRKRKVTLAIAHQGANDMRSIEEKGMDKFATDNSVKVNTQIRFIYRQTEPDDVEYVAEMSGPVNLTVAKAEQTSIDRSGGETWNDKRTLANVQSTYIEPATIRSLQPRVGLLFSPFALAQPVWTSWIQTTAEDEYFATPRPAIDPTEYRPDETPEPRPETAEPAQTAPLAEPKPNPKRKHRPRKKPAVATKPTSTEVQNNAA